MDKIMFKAREGLYFLIQTANWWH